MIRKPVVLVILDGYGVAPNTPESTWKYAKRPNFEMLEKFYPFTALQASGVAVGLPWGKEGNSEVGHLTMGAGRVIYTHLPRIIMSIQDKSFFENPVFKKSVKHVQENNSSLHLLGLFSSGSVHSYVDHLYALLELARKNSLKKVFLHLFTDGRDAPLQEASKFFTMLEGRLAKEYPFAKIASVIGRHYAMDRDNHWDSIEKTYNLLVSGAGEMFEKASAYIGKNYERGLTDEFVEPGFLSAPTPRLDNRGSESQSLGVGVGRIKEGDAVIFFNYREDSARELASAFMLDGFDKFPRKKLANLFFVTMTEYDPSLPGEAAFKTINIQKPIAKVISEAGLKQLHVAETEKYAHVTYFFNGGIEKPFSGEDRILVPSLQTSHFDERPEMSAREISQKVLASLLKYDFILANLANADMVGHTGNFEATVRAIEVLDEVVGKIVSTVLEEGGTVIIIGDHGNAEEKLEPVSGEKRTRHTSNPVPFFVVSSDMKFSVERSEEEIAKNYKKVSGTLADVAPTILELLGLKKPVDMTGISLIKNMR